MELILLFGLASLLVWGAPTARILQRFGKSALSALYCVMPFGYAVALWDITDQEQIGKRSNLSKLFKDISLPIAALAGAIIWLISGSLLLGMCLFLVTSGSGALALVIEEVGYSRWLQLIAFMPVLSICLIWWFAYSQWPAEPVKAGKSSETGS